MTKTNKRLPGAKAGRRPSSKRKTDPGAPGAPPVGHNEPPALTEDEKRELFATHRSSWNEWQAKLKQVEALGKDVKDALKADGFTIKQFKIADDLANNDEKVKDEVADRLTVARWLGHPLGAQLDMFVDRVPIADRAFEEGKQASIENRAAKPEYAPETEAYRAYMAGYHEHQRELVGGMKAADSADESAMAHS